VRAVFDANVLISAMLTPGGGPGELVVRWLGGEFELVVSERLIAELAGAMSRPRLRNRIPEDDAIAFLHRLRAEALHAPDPPDPPHVTADPDDDYLIALAESQSAMLVSGDRHLLELAERLPIRSPKVFLAELP
jgi:uncharacterized protein